MRRRNILPTGVVLLLCLASAQLTSAQADATDTTTADTPAVTAEATEEATETVMEADEETAEAATEEEAAAEEEAPAEEELVVEEQQPGFLDQLFSGTGQITFGTTFVRTSGDKQAFRHDHQIDSHFLYGIQDFWYRTRVDGARVNFTARAIEPYDYGFRLEVDKRDSMFFGLYFDQFPRYYDSSNYFYPFAPFVYELNKDMVTVRRNVGGWIGWHLDEGDKIQFRFDHWERYGDRNTFWGGEVVSGATRLWYYPSYEIVDQRRDMVGVDYFGRLGPLRTKLGVEFLDYVGRDQSTEHRFAAGGAVSQIINSFDNTGWRELRPYYQMHGDLVENVLRLEFNSYIRLVDTDAARQVRSYTAAGVPRDPWSLGNRHDGELIETLVNARLIYTPTDRLTLFGGLGFKYADSDNDSLELLDAVPIDGIPNTITRNSTNERRQTYMMNMGASYEFAQWLSGKVEGRWEHSDMARDWQRTRLLGAVNDLNFQEDSDRDDVEYIITLAAKPRRDLKVTTRWRQQFVNYDSNINRDIRNGVVNVEAYPGRMGDRSRQVDEWSVLTQYRPNRYWTGSYKLIGRITDFNTHRVPGRNIATQKDIINSLSLTFSPTEKFSITGSGGIQRMFANTWADQTPTGQIEDFNGSANFWGLDASYLLSSDITLTGSLYRTTANSVFDFVSTNLLAGVAYKVNKTWSLQFDYGFSKFNESGNGNINDYNAHTFGVRAVARF